MMNPLLAIIQKKSHTFGETVFFISRSIVTKRKMTTSSNNKVVEPKILSPKDFEEASGPIMEMARGYFQSQALYAVTRLGVPDAIGSGSFTVDEIVEHLVQNGSSTTVASVDTINKDALNRCLRFLATEGIFHVSGEKATTATSSDGNSVAVILPRYSLAPRGAVLQTNISNTMAPNVLHISAPYFVEGWTQLYNFVAGNVGDAKCPFDAAHGQSCFDFFEDNPEAADHFNKAMNSGSAKAISAVLNSVPWEEYSGKRVLDVGGNYGVTASKIKESFPDIEMYSLDLPSVIQACQDDNEVPDGVELVAGDFFDASTYPKDLDAIYMKHILHDWDDQSCIKILQSCDRVLLPSGKVHVLDRILPDPGEEDEMTKSKYSLDMMMLTINGKERTKTQWRELADAAGFKVESFYCDSGSPVGGEVTTLIKK